MAISGAEDILIRIGFDASQVTAGMRAAMGSVDRGAKAMSADLKGTVVNFNNFGKSVEGVARSSRTASGVMAGLQRRVIGLGAAFAAARGAMASIQSVDAIALVNTRMKGLLGSTGEVKEITDRLYESAQRLGVPYDSMAESAARVLPAVKAMGGASEHAVRISEILAITARQSGASTQEAASAAMQFSQALGSGVLQGEELRSILENNQTLARTLADALGKDVGELKKLGAEGALTSEVVANAMLGAYGKISDGADAMDSTVGQAWNTVTNAIQKALFAMDQTTGVSGTLIGVLRGIATVLDVVATNFFGAAEGADALKNSNIDKFAALTIGVFAKLADMTMAFAEQINILMGSITRLGVAMRQVDQWDFEGAWGTVKQGVDSVGDSVKRVYNLMTGGAGSASEALKKSAIVAPKVEETPLAKLSGKPKSAEDLAAEKDKLKDPLLDVLKGRIAALRAQQQAYRTNLEERLKLAEQESEVIAATYGRQSKEFESSQGRILSIKRRMATQKRRIDQVSINETEDALLDQLEAEERALESAIDLRRVTADQALAMQRSFEERRYAIQLEAAERSHVLLKEDPDRNPVAIARSFAAIEELTRQHHLKLGEMRNISIGDQLSADATDQVWGSMESGFSTMVENLAQGTLKLRDVWSTAMYGMLDILIKTVADMAAQWLFGEVARTKVTAANAAARGTIETGAAAKSVATNASAASSNVMNSAWEAMAHAYKAIAGIPYVGPVLAPIAAGAAFAGVAAIVGNIASAEGGYDIPAGVNPMVQLHEKEMVLPKAQANAVRKMAGEDGEAGGGITVNFPINTPDAAGVQRFFKDNRAELRREMSSIMGGSR